MPLDFSLSQSVAEQAKALGVFLLVGLVVGIINVVIKIVKTHYTQKLWSRYAIDFLRVTIDGLSFAISLYAFFDFQLHAFHIGVYVLSATLTYRLVYLHAIPKLKNYIYTKRSK